jgi:protein gp37
MAEKTGIAWCDHTANFWIGCTHQSPGCVNCYAEAWARNRMGLDLWGPRPQRQFVKSVWENVPRWNAAAKRDGVRRRVFCMSLGDFFEPRRDIGRDRVCAWDLIEESDSLDWQILTKHAASIAGLLPRNWGDGWPHVWLGVSVEDQQRADERIPLLLSVPAVVRFVSAEPLLGPIDLKPRPKSDMCLHCGGGPADPHPGHPYRNRGLDWVIVGGESGPGRRPMDPAWVVALHEQCRGAGVAFFFKQGNAFHPGKGTMPDGSTPREFPRSRSVAA